MLSIKMPKTLLRYWQANEEINLKGMGRFELKANAWSPVTQLGLVCMVSLRPRQLLGYIADGPQDRASGNLAILRAATHETELGDHDFCLSRSHYTDTDWS